MAGSRRNTTRGELKSGESFCSRCDGLCCKYFALPLSEPTTWGDFDDIRWYLAHDDVSVFVDGGTWYLLVDNRCRFLTPDNRCRIYAQRPRICRRYGDRDCEYHDEDGSVYDMLFESPEQVWEYAEAVLPPRRKR